MSTRFALNQSSDGNKQSVELKVPGCNRKCFDDAGVIVVEIKNGKPVLYVYSDINIEDWTYRIELRDALESNREPEEEPGENDEPANKSE